MSEDRWLATANDIMDIITMCWACAMVMGAQREFDPQAIRPGATWGASAPAKEIQDYCEALISHFSAAISAFSKRRAFGPEMMKLTITGILNMVAMGTMPFQMDARAAAEGIADIARNN